MGIQYWATLGRAWRRMTHLLFRPFDPVKWLILAFCAFVAGLLDGPGGGSGGGNHRGGPGGRFDAEDISEALRQGLDAVRGAWEWVLGHWGATLFVFVGLPLLIALVLAVVWVSSRFKLIFLDNLVRGRAEIVEPWRRLARLGDSLFLFRIAFGLAVLVVGGAFVLLLVSLGIFTAASKGSAPAIAGLVIGGLLFFAFMVAALYAGLFLESFVVPIMYRHGLSAVPAWRVFLPRFGADGASFLLYGLFVLLLFVAAALAIGVVGFATCCIGFLVLMIPFIGTVLLLPLIVTYRYLSLEFLAQFDPSLDVFAA